MGSRFLYTESPILAFHPRLREIFLAVLQPKVSCLILYTVPDTKTKSWEAIRDILLLERNYRLRSVRRVGEFLNKLADTGHWFLLTVIGIPLVLIWLTLSACFVGTCAMALILLLDAAAWIIGFGIPVPVDWDLFVFLGIGALLVLVLRRIGFDVFGLTKED